MDEHIEQIKRLQVEVRKLTDIINSETDGIQALKNQVIERDKILDEKRAEITTLKSQLETCGLTAEQQMGLNTLARLKAVLKELA